MHPAVLIFHYLYFLIFPNIRKLFRNKYYITEVNVVVSSSVQVFKISPVSITAKHLKISNVNVGWVGWGGSNNKSENKDQYVSHKPLFLYILYN